MQNNEPVVVIGAGKTGRGFIARLLCEWGVPFVLADRDRKLIERLSSGYAVNFFDGRKSVHIKPDAVQHIDDPALLSSVRRAKTVFVSVGMSNLADVAKRFGESFAPGANVFLCENGENVAVSFMQALPSTCRAALVDTAIFCTTIEDATDILSENYDVIPFDRKAVHEALSPWAFLEAVENFPALMTRKLFTYNAASAIICYVGALRDHTYFADAANDAYVLGILQTFYPQIGSALCKEFGYSEEDQQRFAERSFKKFTDKSITDSIQRNARDPRRKLLPGERLIGPLRLVERYGGSSEPLEIAIAAAVAYQKDIEWSEYVRREGCARVLEQVCEVAQTEPISLRIIERFNEMTMVR